MGNNEEEAAGSPSTSLGHRTGSRRRSMGEGDGSSVKAGFQGLEIAVKITKAPQ